MYWYVLLVHIKHVGTWHTYAIYLSYRVRNDEKVMKLTF